MLSSILLAAASAAAVQAQASASQSTAAATGTPSITTSTGGPTVISGWTGASTGVVGRILGVNNCETTVEATCTSGLACASIQGIPITYTQGPNDYQFRYSTSTLGAFISVSESCSFEGPVGSPTLAPCYLTAVASANGVQSTTTKSSTISGALLSQGPITITSGASALATTTGACTPTATAKSAASTSKSLSWMAGVGAAVLSGLLLL